MLFTVFIFEAVFHFSLVAGRCVEWYIE